MALIIFLLTFWSTSHLPGIRLNIFPSPIKKAVVILLVMVFMYILRYHTAVNKVLSRSIIVQAFQDAY